MLANTPALLRPANRRLIYLSYCSIFGALGENRTPDTRIFNPVLYQLSYKCILHRTLSQFGSGWLFRRLPLFLQDRRESFAITLVCFNVKGRVLVYRVGIEPTTYGLRVRRSTAELPVHYLEDTLTNTISGPIGLFYVAA